MKRNKPIDKYAIALILIVCVLILRAFLGLDWTDEAYYSALTYRILLGDPVFLSSWDIHQLSALIELPLMYIYVSLVGSSDGCILFMRLAYLFLLFAVVFLFYKKLRAFIGPGWAFLAVLPFFASQLIRTLSYNSMFILSLSFAVLMLSEIFEKGGFSGKKQFFLFGGGVFTALAVQAYPSAVILLPLFAAFIALESSLVLNKRERIKALFLFAAGGIAVLAVFIVFLLLTSSVTAFIDCIPYMLADPEHQGTFSLFESFRAAMELIWAPCIVAILLLSVGASFLRKYSKSIFLFSGIVVAAECLYGALISGFTVSLSVSFYIATAFPVIFSLCSFRWHPVLWLYVLGYAASLAVDISSNNPAAFCVYPCVFSAIATIIYMAEMPVKAIYGKLHSFGGACLTMLMAAAIVLNVVFVYRDSNLLSLDSKLKSGPALGIWTTEERAEDYAAAMDIIEGSMPQTGNVLYTKLFPMGYLCTEARPASPRLWRTALDYELFEEYYRLNPDKHPDAIFILNENFAYSNEDNRMGAFFERYLDDNEHRVETTEIGTIIKFR